ncbi:hypothetical protein OBBRIDRAFT_192958 [Obba rivulosa]|uniref:Uncharacterized protein n=1 Tax=Obba rivulosa TaxID=1052685 RepID=A0A8E2ARX8_9APHY|nr:hypothetical protein OBBRIDRAFT_192958 [Obba rivulosa]
MSRRELSGNGRHLPRDGNAIFRILDPRLDDDSCLTRVALLTVAPSPRNLYPPSSSVLARRVSGARVALATVHRRNHDDLRADRRGERKKWPGRCPSRFTLLPHARCDAHIPALTTARPI